MASTSDKTENPKVTVSSEGTPETKPQIPDYKPVAGASLDKLAELEAALKNKIAGFTAAQLNDVNQKKALEDRISADIQLIKKSSIDQLNDANKTPLEDSKGLADRQKKTNEKVAELLKNGNDKTLFLEELTNIHNMRRTLLDRQINRELNAKYNHAYDQLNVTLGKNTQTVEATSADDTEIVPKVTNKLQAELAKSHQQTLVGQGDKKVHFTDNNNATSNDPKALGAAMVAKGLTNIKFSGHPENALIAAEEALRCGADTFEFDDKTMDALRNEKGYFYSTAGPKRFKQVNDMYDNLQKMAAAKRYAKAQSANNVFNRTDEVSPGQNVAITFGQLQTPEEHSIYLNYLSGAQQAQLAMDLMQQNRANDVEPNYKLNGIPKTEFQYIREILENQDAQNHEAGRPTMFSLHFQEHYAKLQVDDKKLGEFRAGNNPVEMGKYIADIQDVKTRIRYYQEIDKLDNPAIKNEVRAACLGAIIDRSFKDKLSNPKDVERQIQSNNGEIQELLRGITSADERKEIRNLFDNNFNRAKIKLAELAPGSTLKEPPSNFTQTPEQWKAASEGANSTKLLKSQKDFMFYRSFVGKAYHALNVIDQQPTLVAKDKFFTQQDPDIVTLSTSPRPGAAG